MYNRKLKMDSEDIFGVGLFLGTVITIIVCLCSFVFASNKVEYCYIEFDVGNPPMIPSTYTLKGYISWRPDRTISAKIPSMENAKAQADMIACSIE